MLTEDKRKTLFLLGGHDLEMCTIREILASHHYLYVDHQLGWADSKLSNYREEIDQFYGKEPDGLIYGIELENDIGLNTRHYISIDHHNEYADRVSALEQIVVLLQLPMNRMWNLIAANDKRYIPGMEALGATKEEINTIRLLDRQAQGVTASDEHLAQKAIMENLTKRGDLIIVKSFSSRFSPICDRLFPYEKLLVFTDEEWMYYGKQVDRLVEIFQSDIQNGLIFYGGGHDGYIGCKRKVYTSNEIQQHIELIKNLMNHGNI